MSHSPAISSAPALDTLIDLLPIGAVIIDRQLQIHGWNKTLTEWTGVSAAEAVNTNLGEREPHLTTPRFADRLQQVFDSGQPAVYSAALHKHFLRVPARHGRRDELMIQQTHVRRLNDFPHLALVTLQDCTIEYQQLRELRCEHAELNATRRELEDTNDALAWKLRVIHSVSQVQSRYIGTTDIEKCFAAILEEIVDLSQSDGGRIQEIQQTDDGRPAGFVTLATQDHCEDAVAAIEQSDIPESLLATPPTQTSVDQHVAPMSLVLPETCAASQTLLSSPSTTDNWPVLQSETELAFPLFHGDQIVGIVHLYRAAGYASPALVQDMLPVIVATAHILVAEQQRRERRKALARLRMQEDDLRTLSLVAAHTNNLMIMTDADGLIVWTNKAFQRKTGYALEEAIGQRPEMLLRGEETDPNSLEYIQDCVCREIGLNLELQCYTRDGKKFWSSVEMQPIRNADGGVTNFIGVQIDITERREAETTFRKYADRLQRAQQQQEQQTRQLTKLVQELEQAKQRAESADHAKSEFLANMSHEIRTPMTAVLGFAELLEEPQLDEDERRDAISTIRKNGVHLLALINDILDLSKIEAGRMALQVEPCHVAELVDDLEDLMRERAQRSGLHFVTQIDDNVPAAILTDRTRLRQILVNLMGNAIKFTPEGQVRLHISNGPQPGMLQFSVCDTGIGIDEADLARLFQPFVQADTSLTRQYGGTGLGLTISRRLAEILGGNITVTSQPLKGSQFQLTIRANTSEPAAHAPPPATPEACPLPKARAQRILFAEDYEDSRRLLRMILDRAGFDVTEAVDGTEAVAAVRKSLTDQQPFDLILLDMQMPNLDGVGALAKIHALGHTGPVLALTAHSMSSDRDYCLEQGFDGFLTKPISRQKLLTQIAEWTTKETCPLISR